MKFIISRKFVSEIIQPTNDDDVARQPNKQILHINLMDLTTSHVIFYTDKSKFAPTYLDCSLSIIDYIYK